jgi:hypothetical protein
VQRVGASDNSPHPAPRGNADREQAPQKSAAPFWRCHPGRALVPADICKRRAGASSKDSRPSLPVLVSSIAHLANLARRVAGVEFPRESARLFGLMQHSDCVHIPRVARLAVHPCFGPPRPAANPPRRYTEFGTPNSTNATFTQIVPCGLAAGRLCVASGDFRSRFSAAAQYPRPRQASQRTALLCNRQPLENCEEEVASARATLKSFLRSVARGCGSALR